MKKFNDISNEDGKEIVKFTRTFVEEYIKNKIKIQPSRAFQDKFSFNAGIFVTINKMGQLRGCIGFPVAEKKFFQSLPEAAALASTEDPRFEPLSPNELENVVFEVTILSPPELIDTKVPNEILQKIELNKHGLIIKKGFRSGLLLPQVPKQFGWNKKDFLENTCEKAGLFPNEWMDKDVQIQKFEGIIFEEKDPKGEILRKVL